MARKRLEDVLAELHRVVPADPRGAAALRLLRDALAGRSPHAAAKAARLAGESGVEDVVPDLERAFERWLEGAGDVGCTAKTAIARALDRLEHCDPQVFLRGIRHVQMEGAFGEPIDTATELRGVCALALVRMGYRDALRELADLLADRQAHARAAAARALGLLGGEGAAALLRFKARLGDAGADVLCECLTALLAASGRAALEFVAGFLSAREPDVAEAAALALGASRQPAACEHLREWHERTRGSRLEATALTALATLRSDAAIDYLLDCVRAGEPACAERAVAALGLYRGDEALAARVRQAAEEGADPRISAAARRAFC